MAINEFRREVEPVIPGHWHTAKLEHDGFEVKIAEERIEARGDDFGQQDFQHGRAQEIVESVVRKIGLEGRTRFTATFTSASRFDPQSGRRDTGISHSEDVGIKWSGDLDVVKASADGTVPVDSQEERMSEPVRFADDATINDTLCRMSDYKLGYYTDPDKKLAPLYDIFKLATTVFGGRDKASTHYGSVRGAVQCPSVSKGPDLQCNPKAPPFPLPPP